MSISATIDIQFVSNSNKPISVIEIINGLLNYGWSLNDNGRKSYLPIGDDGNYNWVMEDISKEDLFKLLINKERRKENVGVSLTWEETNIGGTLLIWNRKSLSFNLTINRKIINKSLEITDINWYLERLITGLTKGGAKVTSFSFEQFY